MEAEDLDQHGGSAVTARRVAALVMIVQGLTLLGFFAFFLYEMTSGATDDMVRAGTLGGLILVFAIAGTLLGRAWLRGAGWPRTPTILWNALLVPVAWSLHDAGRNAIGALVAALALAGLVGAVKAGQPGSVGRDADEVS
ncbi:MAG: hypothetical protein L0H79_07370 [Intrasporangium sp.]|uniref:hypothetical protein n=1 Tax=Intrasporangium sp. TaxID=1925024 RepID=UPI00264A49B3|nr:hypothetical protein [Intrasporangium sp.]MDN5795558.1 hypothetical protein [Intrasporangium sp.]